MFNVLLLTPLLTVVICADVPDDILEQLKWLKDGLDAINKWKEEVLSLSTWLGVLIAYNKINKTKSLRIIMFRDKQHTSVTRKWKRKYT